MTIFDTRSIGIGWPGVESAMNLTPLHMAETFNKQVAMQGKWRRTRNQLLSNYYSLRSGIEKFQLKRIRFMVDWAFLNSNFYREIYSRCGYEVGAIRSFKDFECLPIVTKNNLIEGFSEGVVSTKHDLTKLRWMSTSGSSGKQVQMVLTEGRADLDTLFRMRMFELQSQTPLDEKAWIYNIHFVPWWYSSLGGDYPVFSLKPECSPKELLAHIRTVKPQVISCIGSYLDCFESYGGALQRAGVRLISTNSEFTHPLKRLALEESLGVKVLDEYSSEELNIIAFECPFRNYHLSEDDIYSEVVGGRIGKVLGTDLWNTAMPVIRYEQGDLAELNTSREKCKCGSYYRRLKSIHGRADQNFVTKHGAVIRSAVLLDVVEQYFCIEPLVICEFRMVQVAVAKIKLIFVPLRKPPPSFFRSFEMHMVELFGHDLTFEYVSVACMPTLSSYKRRTFICEV